MDRKTLIFWIGLFFAIVMVNAPSLSGPYILDDSHTILENAHIHSLSSVAKIWTSGRYYSALPATWGYRPVTTTVTAVLWSLGSGETWPFHAAKWFLFFFICYLSFHIWRRLLPEVPERVLQVAIVIFAVNPVHSQLMGYISASSSLLATLFVVLAIRFYLLYRDQKRESDLFISLIAVFLATMSKEEGVVVVGLLPAIEVYLCWKQNRSLTWLRLKPLLAHFLVGCVGVFLIFYHFEPTQNLVRTGISPWQYFMTQWRAYLRYMAMFLWSFDLNADNLNFGFSKALTDWKVLSALAGNLVLVGWALKKWRSQPLLLLVLFWFYASVAPSSSIIALGEPVNDHRALTAYVGMGLLFVLLLLQIEKWQKKMFWIASTALFVSYSFMSLTRAQVWNDRIALWEDTVEKNPASGRAYNNLATALMAESRYQEALQAVNTCVQLASHYSYCHVNKAVILAELGREEHVNSSFAKAVELDLHFVTSRLFWSQYLQNRGLLQKAKNLLVEADKFTSGNHLPVRIELIETLYRMGMTDEAEELKQEAIVRFGKKNTLLNLKPF